VIADCGFPACDSCYIIGVFRRFGRSYRFRLHIVIPCKLIGGYHCFRRTNPYFFRDQSPMNTRRWNLVSQTVTVSFTNRLYQSFRHFPFQLQLIIYPFIYVVDFTCVLWCHYFFPERFPNILKQFSGIAFHLRDVYCFCYYALFNSVMATETTNHSEY
jgi:hypothetical protein